MAAANSGNSFAASSGEGNGFLYFLEGLGLDVELWRRVKGSGPGVMGMLGRCSERDAAIELVEFVKLSSDGRVRYVDFGAHRNCG